MPQESKELDFLSCTAHSLLKTVHITQATTYALLKIDSVSIMQIDQIQKAYTFTVQPNEVKQACTL